MIKIEIKHWITGSILFEYSKENNTIKDTVIEAVKKRANLDGANLDGANLDGANLDGANLDGANLYGANLYGANLDGANLYGANLVRANLVRANLYGANLYGANLYGANLYGANLVRANLYGANLDGMKFRENEVVKTAAFLNGLYKYIVIPYITDQGEKRVKMGCHNRTVEEWENDFWNNPNEFPNDGSEPSLLRVMAFETAKKWFEITLSKK